MTDDNEGWIEWSGGKCPVDARTFVDVRDADGDIWRDVHAVGCVNSRDMWEHKCELPDCNIVAYRVVKQ